MKIKLAAHFLNLTEKTYINLINWNLAFNLATTCHVFSSLAFWEEAGVGKILVTGDLLAYWQFTAPHLSWWMAADRADKSTPKRK